MKRKVANKVFAIAGLIFCLLLFHSCMNDETWVEAHKPNISLDKILDHPGLVILNEGNFMYGNASISYYDPEERKVENDVFYRQNGVPLGDVAQSANVFKGEMYIVLNNSGKIVLVNFGRYPALKAFEMTHKIAGLTSPRYVWFIDSTKAYISDLYAKSVRIFNPRTYTLTGSIPLFNSNPDYYQHPTEQFVEFGGEIFTNCYSFDNKVLVLDPSADRLIDSITVLRQPNSMVIDRNGKIWVLCDGGYEGSIYGNDSPGLVRIDAFSHTVEKIFILTGDDWPSKLCLNGGADTLYFINRDVWRMPVSATRLPENSFISAESESGRRLFYGLGVDPISSEVYVSDAIDHVQSGIIYRYTTEGAGVDTFQAGIIPGFFWFVQR